MVVNVQAVATAFASGFAQATSECGQLCDVNTTIVSEAIGSVLATATSEIYDKKCGGGSALRCQHQSEQHA